MESLQARRLRPLRRENPASNAVLQPPQLQQVVPVQQFQFPVPPPPIVQPIQPVEVPLSNPVISYQAIGVQDVQNHALPSGMVQTGAQVGVPQHIAGENPSVSTVCSTSGPSQSSTANYVLSEQRPVHQTDTVDSLQPTRSLHESSGAGVYSQINRRGNARNRSGGILIT